MVKKLGVLFSGGKDSVYAAYLAKKENYSVGCLITIESKNKDSYMFHTPSIEKTKKQAEVMSLPLISFETLGEKEKELDDLKSAIKLAVIDYGIEGIVTGAIKSVYQASRVQEICFDLGIEVFNPLWQREEETYMKELIGNKFEIIIVGVFAYPFDKSWVFRKIDEIVLEELERLNEKYKINVAGEGGEFESFVLNCPLYSRGLRVLSKNILVEGENSFRGEVEVE